MRHGCAHQLKAYRYFKNSGMSSNRTVRLSDTEEVRPQGDIQMAAAPGRREAGKIERRQRIIRAARQLIRETGNAGLSMRALAQRAGVSLATPYNLFGSKRAIVLAVLEDVREFQQRFSSAQSVDPLERIFTAVDIAMDFYLADPPFYRTLWAAVFDTGDELRDAIFNPERNAFWQNLVDNAAGAGVLMAAIDRALLGRHLDLLFRAVMLDWVVGDIQPEALAATARMGYALILKGACSPEWSGPLQARILESQAVAIAATRRDNVPTEEVTS
jgi:AcrR family transcriptional regulator